MFCPSGVHTGFIQLTGPIAQVDLKSITKPIHPLTISFAARTTIPTLDKNIIMETASQNTCTYSGKVYELANVQIVTPTNKGYILPGMNDTPVAELIVSFKAKDNSNTENSNKFSGVLLCVPIYNTGIQKYSEYLTHIVQNDATTTSIPSLESVFYEWKGDTVQTSLQYTTCFETIDTVKKTSSYRSLSIFVFPYGIHLAADIYQKLLQKIGSTLKSYMVPPAIRGEGETLQSFTTDSNGNKVSTKTSSDGIIYTVPLSTCTDDFKNNFMYYSLPPRSAKSNTPASGKQCPYYQTSQYKCVPFNQLRDLSGAYVVPGNKSMDTILREQNQVIAGGAKIPEITTSDIEKYVASGISIIIIIILLLAGGSYIANRNKPNSNSNSNK